MSDEKYEVKREQVYNREESASRLFGWTISELALIIGLVFATNLVTGSTKLTLAVGALTYIYIRKLKQKLPERFISSFLRFQTRRHTLYRAAGRDAAWRPPVTPNKP